MTVFVDHFGRSSDHNIADSAMTMPTTTPMTTPPATITAAATTKSLGVLFLSLLFIFTTNGAGSNSNKSNDPSGVYNKEVKRGHENDSNQGNEATASGDARTTTRGRAQQGRAQGVPRAHMYVFFTSFVICFY